MHQIDLSPMRRDDRLEVSVSGDVFTINGAAFGFDGTGTGTGTHPQVRSAGIRRLGATSRPLAAVSTIARADVGPGAG